MKIYIGPYLNYFGPYQAADFLQHIGVSEERCDKIGDYLAKTWFGDILNAIHECKKRKVKIRIDEYDSWSADHTLALVILPVLKQLKETKHGSSGKMQEFAMTSEASSQYCFDFYAEDDDKAWKAGHKKWDETLDKMIWSFEQILDDNWEDQYWTQKPIIDLDIHSEDTDFEYKSLRWKQPGICDWDGVQKHQMKIDEGLELFGKHYRDLWD